MMARGVDMEGLADVTGTGVGYAQVEHLRDAIARVEPADITERAARLSEYAPRSPELDVAARWGRLWSEALRSPTAALATEAGEAAREATRIGSAEFVVELTAVQAFILLASGDHAEATRVARRASRMGRTEAMPQQEYLANLVLARLRRATGRPHLATQILSSLMQVAPARWQAWIAWELALAGSLQGAALARSNAHEGSLMVPVDALLGRRGSLRPDALGATFRDELEAIRAALDVDVPPPQTVADWLRGTVNEIPPALQGLALVADANGDPRPRVVATRAGARRLIAVGATAPEALVDPKVAPHPRTETLLCVVAQAGPDGLERDALFHSVYGFAFEAAVHQGSFDVLVHRARAWLGDRAELVREPRFALRVSQTLAIPDPRCERPIDDRLLQLLAERGGIPAKEAAAELNVPLRTVQTLLKQLVEDGACDSERRGRQIVYRVEDTTFREPTVY